jgi:hypothetical protein
MRREARSLFVASVAAVAYFLGVPQTTGAG